MPISKGHKSLGVSPRLPPKENRTTYSKIKRDLGALVLHISEEACTLMGLQHVCQRRGRHSRGAVGQQARDCCKSAHRGGNG